VVLLLEACYIGRMNAPAIAGSPARGRGQPKAWSPAFENYSFVAAADATKLRVSLDVPPEYEQFMNDTWPQALARLRTLCEAR
jgi:hypothetical protein